MLRKIIGFALLLSIAWAANEFVVRPKFGGTPDRPAGVSVSSGGEAFKLSEARAISGDQIEIKQRRFVLRGVKCPAPSTERGRDAKALMNTFLRTNIECGLSKSAGEQWVGECTANGQDVAAALIKAGYCDPTN